MFFDSRGPSNLLCPDCQIVSWLSDHEMILDARYFRNDYTFHPEVDGWLKVHLIPSNWNEARLRCHLEGAVLASPLNDELSKAMKNLISKTCPVFIGISATYSRGDFYSVEGISLEKISVTWAPGEPDNHEDKEQCIVFLPNGTVADEDCQETYPYICYKKNSEDMPTPQKCGTVDMEYTYSEVTSHCYKFHPTGQSWSRAFMTCSAEGGYLAIINTEKEGQVLTNLFTKYPAKNIIGELKDYCFLGIRAENNTYDYMTVHGQTLKESGPELWESNQPAHPKTEFCPVMARNGKYHDYHCETRNPFICEKTPGSLLDNQNGTTEEIGK